MTTFSKKVRLYEKKCSENNIPEETVMAYLVELSNRERYNLYMNFDEEMPTNLEEEFDAGMARILNDEPLGHVLGYSWFYGYKMIVNGDVLIPRYETEELCGHILSRIDEYFGDKKELDVADVGTGSGAIAIALCKEEPKIKMSATDISEEALETAKQNALNNEAKITFYAGDMLKSLIDKGIKLDILVSNPPYIPSHEEMEHAVVDYEPHVALFGGEDGLKFYREIFRDCKQVLKDKAFMAFEMGYDQRERMTNLVQEMLPEARFEILKDMNGKDRMLFVYFSL